VAEVDFRSRTKAGTDSATVSAHADGRPERRRCPWIVQYRIKDPYNFLFKVANVRKLLTDMSEAAMRLVVGDRSINEVISKRDEIAIEAMGLLQRELDQAETGIHVVTIEMKKTNVPSAVQPSFNEVKPGDPGKGADDLSGERRLQQGDSDGARRGRTDDQVAEAMP